MKEFLFIMKSTVLIAFLKLPAVLTLLVLEKLSFFLPCCLSEIKIMPIYFFSTLKLLVPSKEIKINITVNTQSKRKTPPLCRFIKKELPERWRRVFPFHLMLLIAVLMNGLNLSCLSCSTEQVIFSSCSPKLLLLLYSGISIDTLSILQFQAQ